MTPPTTLRNIEQIVHTILGDLLNNHRIQNNYRIGAVMTAPYNGVS